MIVCSPEYKKFKITNNSIERYTQKKIKYVVKKIVNSIILNTQLHDDYMNIRNSNPPTIQWNETFFLFQKEIVRRLLRRN